MSWDFETAAVEDRHLVHLYSDPIALRDAVSAWFAPAFANGGGAILVATPAHAALVKEGLARRGLDLEGLVAADRLVVLDARATLRAFMVDGVPDYERFLRVLQPALEKASSGGRPVRAWGEMVDLLRKDGEVDAALMLESCWNAAMDTRDFRLLCSYEADALDPHTYRTLLAELCQGHSRLLGEPEAFEAEVRTSAISVLGYGVGGAVFAPQAAGATPWRMSATHAALHDLARRSPALAGRILGDVRRRRSGHDAV